MQKNEYRFKNIDILRQNYSRETVTLLNLLKMLIQQITKNDFFKTTSNENITKTNNRSSRRIHFGRMDTKTCKLNSSLVWIIWLMITFTSTTVFNSQKKQNSSSKWIHKEIRDFFSINCSFNCDDNSHSQLQFQYPMW